MPVFRVHRVRADPCSRVDSALSSLMSTTCVATVEGPSLTYRNMRIAVLTSAFAHAVLLALAASVPASAADDGQAAFNNHCRTCHSMNENDNRLGPSLHRIFGAKAGAVPGYAAYSYGLVSSGIIWNESTLDKFIADPEAVVRNNNMKPYKGITDKSLRMKIIEFLKSDLD